jgi:Arc/MetJ-type ribon-helix-helix transcriptional regulator
MATVKATITLDEEDLEKIRGLVAAGKAASISGFVQHAVTTALHDVAGWGAILSGALEQTGGPLKKRERAWADGILAGTNAKKTRRSRAACRGRRPTV